MSEWMVLQRDRLPAYITWERYEANQQRLLQNSPRPDSPGVPRNGRASLTQPAGLRSMWPAHVRQLSKQVERLLWVYAEEE